MSDFQEYYFTPDHYQFVNLSATNSSSKVLFDGTISTTDVDDVIGDLVTSSEPMMVLDIMTRQIHHMHGLT